MSAESKTSDAELNSSPSYLLASLFAARKAGDKLLERLNTRRLAELGIKVQFASAIKPRKPSRKVVPRG